MFYSANSRGVYKLSLFFNAIATNDTVAQLEETMAEVNTSIVRVCNEGFFISENTGLCTPECGVWEEFPHSFVVGIDVVAIFSGIVYFLSGAAVLVLSCMSYKRM